MELQQLYTRFPTEETCVTFLEQILWNGRPMCPYCNGSNITAAPGERRHHCNRCKCSFSVRVKTIFHNSRVDLRKWVLAVILYIESDKVSAQHLSRVLGVNKNTAWYMKERLRRDAAAQRTFMLAISKGVRP
jgi:transposase-like protein